MPDTEIYRAYHFTLDVQGEAAAYFTEVTGLSVNVEAIDYREGGAQAAVRKLPGRVSYGEVTLKWGLTDKKDLWDWLMTVVNGNVERKSVSIILHKPDGKDEATRWNLANAWPSSWRGAHLSGLAQEAAIETLTLVHEGLERA
ncbi:MAG TPA: phage tail protein [Candidatus Manganitrophaceae bacterium]|nr:phage tail protein [Candidatus Manganitrophaceae bacterium]